VRPRTRVRFPPPPPKCFELIGDLCLKRRRIWRRLCAPISGGTIQRSGELIELNVVRVLLRRVRPRVAHQALQPDEITTTLPKEAIRESMPDTYGHLFPGQKETAMKDLSRLVIRET
jgi:hypothetical protein